MTRGPRIVSLLIFGVLGGYVAAYALGQTPEVFWMHTVPALVGDGLFVVACVVTVAQVARR